MNVARDWLKRPVGKGFELCIICLSHSSIILCQRHHNWTLNKFLGDLAFFIQDRVFVFDQLYIVSLQITVGFSTFAGVKHFYRLGALANHKPTVGFELTTSSLQNQFLALLNIKSSLSAKNKGDTCDCRDCCDID